MSKKCLHAIPCHAAGVAKRLRTVAVCALVGTIVQASRAQASAPPQGSYQTHRYRNLLAETGHPQAAVNARLEQTFQQLFHGDPNTQAIVYQAASNANGPTAYVTDVANHDVRSEGMSYGMMIAVQTNHKAEFDAIWNWASTRMLITDPNNPAVGYYAWSMNFDGTPRSDSPAPDGEIYFAMSLYFAANRWGNGKGLYDYKAQADRILHVMRHHPVQTGTAPFRIHPEDPPFLPHGAVNPNTRTAPGTSTVGPMVNEQYAMIVFVPTVGANSFTDASYHLPAFFDLWALWGPAEDRAFWAHAADVSRHFFVAGTNPVTGLCSDYANFDGTPRATRFNSVSADFANDSWRTVSNWSFDQAWWGRNPDARMLSDRIQSFLAKQGLATYPDRYTVDGKPLSARHSVGMVATTAVGSLAATPGPQANAFVDQLWNTPIPTGEQRYFDGTLYMMSLLHLSGQFRIWAPPADHR